jgi:hypothetical protein
MAQRLTEKERAYHRNWMRHSYHSNPEARRRRLDSAKNWRIANPEKASFANWRKAIRRKFGITPEKYHAILSSQGGVCALCRKSPEKKRFAVDHDHNTSIVRGILCDSCNRLLGKIEARISLDDLNHYLTKDQAAK